MGGRNPFPNSFLPGKSARPLQSYRGEGSDIMPPTQAQIEAIKSHDLFDLLEEHDGYSEIRPRRRQVMTPVFATPDLPVPVNQ